MNRYVMMETQREYINILLREKYYLSQENKLLMEKNMESEKMIDNIKVKYISYLDDCEKYITELNEKVCALEHENAKLKNQLENEKTKNIPIGMRINDVYDEWEWTNDEPSCENPSDSEKYIIEYLYKAPESNNSSVTTQTEDENNKTIFPDLSSILETTYNNLEDYETYLFDRF
jgi:hypothetical protein